MNADERRWDSIDREGEASAEPRVTERSRLGRSLALPETLVIRFNLRSSAFIRGSKTRTPL